MEKALYWLLNLLKDLLFQRGQNKKDIQYITTQIVLALDRFAVNCAAAVADDGLLNGQTDVDGCRSTQVPDPTFDLNTPEPEWKLLPTKIMHALVHFPNDIDIANSLISAASEHAFPPDYEEAFDERQYQYAKLGIKASRVASDLRAFAKLPPREAEGWDAVKYLEDQLAVIVDRRKKSTALNTELLADFTKLDEDA